MSCSPLTRKHIRNWPQQFELAISGELPKAGMRIFRCIRPKTSRSRRARLPATRQRIWRRTCRTWSAVRPTWKLDDDAYEGLADIHARQLRRTQYLLRRSRIRDGCGDERHDAAWRLQVYGGTFFVFSDYLRPAVRLAALMNLPVIYVLTHDSIAVGEDGPTHEPIEQLASLRVIPDLRSFVRQTRTKRPQHGHYAVK